MLTKTTQETTYKTVENRESNLPYTATMYVQNERILIVGQQKNVEMELSWRIETMNQSLRQVEVFRPIDAYFLIQTFNDIVDNPLNPKQLKDREMELQTEFKNGFLEIPSVVIVHNY